MPCLFISYFLHIHCFVVSYPYCACSLLDLASECLLHHASKCSPYLVKSLCIHWPHIVHPIILPVHDRISNLGFCILTKFDAFTCLSYRLIFPHILSNLSLSCFLQPVILRNKVWNFFLELCHKFDKHWMAVFWIMCLPSLYLYILYSLSCLCWIRV